MKAMFLGLTVLAVSSTAMAQKTPAQRSTAATTYTHRTEMIFKDGEKVEGTVVGPEGVTVGGRKAVKGPSLIKIRPDFLAEMLRTAENI